jgi:hypothetical protein
MCVCVCVCVRASLSLSLWPRNGITEFMDINNVCRTSGHFNCMLDKKKLLLVLTLNHLYIVMSYKFIVKWTFFLKDFGFTYIIFL